MCYTESPLRGRASILYVKCICSAGLLSLFCISLLANPDIPAEKVEGEGLTNFYIKAITQDNKGFLWFGTQEGLFRYDGYQFLPVKNFPGDPLSILNDNIEFLLAAEDGFIWVGSRGGLTAINSSSLIIKNFPAGQAFTVYSLVKKNDNTFYAGTSAGLFEFYKESGVWKRLKGLPENIFTRSVTADGKGNLIIASHQGVYEYNTGTQSYRHFDLPVPPNQKGPASQIAHRSILGKDGNIWITTWNSGLIRFEPLSGNITPFYTPNIDKTFEQYRSGYDLFQDTSGNICMANSENGITVFDFTHIHSSSYRMPWSAGDSISDRVYAVFTDRSGICWIGTENGIYKKDPHSAHFTTIHFLPGRDDKALRSDFAGICTLKDKDGLWWIGSYEGLFLFDPVTGSLKNYSSVAGIPQGTNIFNILQDAEGIIWVTNRNKLVSLKKKLQNGHLSFVNKTYQYPAIQGNIHIAYQDSRKRIWLGTHSNGVFMFDPSAQVFKQYACTDSTIKINKNEIYCFYELPDGNILTGGNNTGLVKLFPETNKYEKIFGFDTTGSGADFTINEIARDDHGRLWLGTQGNGLWQADDSFRHLKQYTIHDGLPSMNITGLLPLVNDHVWMLSEGGVIDFRPLRQKTTIYDKGDGIKNLYNLFFITKVDEYNIAIADMGCIHFYNTAAAGKSLPPPEVVITGFKIFDNPCSFSEGKTVELNYNQNYFSFEYVGLNYTKPAHNMYAYMLEGIDTKWNDAGTRRYISYANLAEGSYTFRIKACNSEGAWNPIPATLHIVIRPPYWHRWWFYLLLTGMAGMLIYLIYFIKRRQLKSKEQLRNKIARDLHDDIGSTLSGINIFSKIALQKLHTDKESSGELLQRINSRTEKTMEALSDIVWSINTKKDNMDNVLSRMREYLGEVIEPLGIQYEFITEGGISNAHIDMEIRKEVYLIFKEAVHNASKYAGCSFISIQFKKQNKSIVLFIEDNGKGFDLRSVVPGNGINNMQERAEKIRAVFEIASETGRGTKVSLVFPIT